MGKRDRKSFLLAGGDAEESPLAVIGGTDNPTGQEAPGSEGAWLRNMTGSTRPQANPNNPISAMREAIERKLENPNPEIEALKAKLESGETVVELNPADIDPSFISDRLEISEEEVDELADQLRDRGQIVPILVRPHPEREGRFQIAYGHRRWRALTKLGLNVKAVVRNLTDAELVVAQGQENNARLDLSFIEKARFAIELEEQGYSRAVICGALAVTENNLSTMIGIAKRIPRDLVKAIGKAPGIGRPRWNELVEILKERKKVSRALEFIDTVEIQRLPSDERFIALHQHLTKKEPADATQQPPKQQSYLNDSLGRRRATISTTDVKCTIQIDRRDDPGFSEFLIQKLDELCREYDAGRAAAE